MTFTKTIIFAAFFYSCWAWSSLEKGTLAVRDGDAQVAYEAQIFDPSQTTLILMPGIYRGLSSRAEDPLLKELSQKKINWVAFHFSVHPESIIQKSTPNVSHLGLQDLAKEAQEVVRQLEVQKPLMVSLSYSSAAASYFQRDDFNILIETAPIGRQDDSSDGMLSYVETSNSLCESYFAQWTPFCVAWESQKNILYNTFWMQKTMGLIPLYPELRDVTVFSSVVSGYVSMARAVEDYDFSKVDFSRGPRRFFILGQNESSTRLQIQWDAIRAYIEQTGETPYVFIIEGAGHVIPTDSPALYLQTLLMIERDELPSSPGVYWMALDGTVTPYENGKNQ